MPTRFAYRMAVVGCDRRGRIEVIGREAGRRISGWRRDTSASGRVRPDNSRALAMVGADEMGRAIVRAAAANSGLS